MTEEVIEKLCEKFGVTTEYLVNELARHSITMDWIGIIFWGVLSIIVTFLCIAFKDKLKDLFDFGTLWTLIVVIPIIIYIVALVAIPCCVMDLISWHISPVASAIKYIGNCF